MRHGRAAGFLALVLQVVIVVAAARAEPASVDARVVWARGDRAYVARADSTSLLAGDLVTFVERKRTIAAGSITHIVDAAIAIVSLTSGSLERVKRLDRVSVVAERPAPKPPPLLRIGIPASGRNNLLIACDVVGLDAPFDSGGVRIDTLSAHVFRFARTALDSTSWPDTVIVRRFREAADQEIALERGDIDVAVFWPGELSSHLRSAPRWQGFALGRPERGVLSAVWFPPAIPETPRPTPGGDDPFGTLALDLFRGDLMSAGAPGDGASAGHTLPDPARFNVDRSIPSWQAMERLLYRAGASRIDRAPVVRVFYLDAAIEDREALERAATDYVASHRVAAELGAGRDAVPSFAHRFAVRYPVLAAPELRPYVNVLGADAIAGLVRCASGRR